MSSIYGDRQSRLTAGAADLRMVYVPTGPHKVSRARLGFSTHTIVRIQSTYLKVTILP